MARRVTRDLVVTAGEVRTYAQDLDNSIAAALLLESEEFGYDPSIINRGEIHLSNSTGHAGRLFYFSSSSFWDHGIVANYGLVSAVVPTDFDVTALFGPTWGPDLYNWGRITVQARYRAIAYETWGDTLAIFNAASGAIEVRSAESPTALRLANGGGTITNNGQILAHATGGGRGFAPDSGTGLALGAGGGSVFGVFVVNAGLIEATDPDPTTDRSTAIWIHGNGVGRITNSGTIRSDYAIREQSEAGFSDPSGLLIENSGLIQGRVILGTGNDMIDNKGRIVGEVVLGLGADFLFSPAGEILGAIFGGDGSDGLFGSAGADTLNGEAGADVIRGGAGADRLNGGAGADLFVYDQIGDSSAAALDVIAGFASGVDRIDLSALTVQSVSIEPGEGFVLLRAAATGGTLVVRVEGTLTQGDLILSASSALAGTSNADMLYASASGSILTGGAGDDVLIGAAGNDRLDGGAGGDTMWGGLGDDVYTVDTYPDVVIELDGQGRDTLELHYQGYYRLADYVEDVVAMHPNSTYIDGNALANRMTGNAGANTFFGRDGNDVIDGGGGNDVIHGGGGSDRLTGGAGADIFAFAAIADSQGFALRSDGRKILPDFITDFISGEDRIDLSAIDAVTGTPANEAFAFLGTGAFTGHAGEIRYVLAGGQLHIYADLDGNGGADLEIVASGSAILLASDFIL